MTIQKDSLRWALDFLYHHSDGDLFPRLLELEAIKQKPDDFINGIAGKPLTEYPPGSCRRFIVPKDDISYRQATQLDPQDNIILSAIIYQFGQGIEERRKNHNTVFSYRFAPSANNGLYNSKDSWNKFWTNCYKESKKYNTILFCDIADFYNQIYHHTVENQLAESNFPNQTIKWIINLLESTTAGVSRGVPIGPHGIHLIAEATLIPIDNSLSLQDIKFCRFVDDIVIFCESKSEAKRALSILASTLDTQQRLTLQRHKTKFHTKATFEALCQEMLEDRPINQDEDDILKLVKKYSGGNPYQAILYSQITDEDWKKINSETIKKIINEYINQNEVDFIRLRWFYRRLAQIGHPGALEVSLERINDLGPCLSNICTYIASIQTLENKKWKEIGKELLQLIEMPEIKENEYFRLSILSLFTRNSNINHIAKLIRMYNTSEPFVRREIILAASVNNAVDWLRELKESFQTMDAWQKNAFLYSLKSFPKDERKYFINNQAIKREFELSLSKWVKNG